MLIARQCDPRPAPSAGAARACVVRRAAGWLASVFGLFLGLNLGTNAGVGVSRIDFKRAFESLDGFTELTFIVIDRCQHLVNFWVAGILQKHLLQNRFRHFVVAVDKVLAGLSQHVIIQRFHSLTSLSALFASDEFGNLVINSFKYFFALNESPILLALTAAP